MPTVMSQPASSPTLLSLEPAIDPYPLTLTPDASLATALAILGKAQSSCVSPSLRLPYDIALRNQARASAIWVLEGGWLVGQFTEQQALAALASGQNLAAITLAEAMVPPTLTLNPAATPDIFDALALLRQHRLRHLPVVGDQGQLVGVITLETIRTALQLDELLKTRSLAEALRPSLPQAASTASVLEVARLMAACSEEYVVLTAASAEQPGNAGLLRVQDIILLQMLEQDLSQIEAQTVMRTGLPVFAPQESVLVAHWTMQQQQAQWGWVTDTQNQLLGLVTLTSFIDRLDLEVMRGAEVSLQRSIQSFAKGSSDRNQDGTAETVPGTVADLQEQLDSSRLLAAMALHIRESLQLQDILQTAVNEVRNFLQTERVLVYQFNPDMSGTVVVESVAPGWLPALNSTVHDTCFGQNYAQAYQAGRTQVVEDIYRAELTQCHIDILAIYDIRASLVVPILQGDHLWGLLCAYHCSQPRHWRSFEVDLLKQLAIHVAIAIQQSELYTQLQGELQERTLAEERLKASLKEKEALLKEIHHRVKNNLQIISSVLRLQSDLIRDAKVLALFNDSQNRIRSMALIHEKLYQSRDLLRIKMDEYLRDLTNNLISSYGALSHGITLQVCADDVWLNIDTAIPCGLIINELVSNALKHAFLTASPNRHQVWVTIDRTADQHFVLTVRDNGVGFPKELDFRNTESLGLELVCIFTEQLEGSIELVDGEGTQFTVAFQEIGDSSGDN